MMALTPIMVRTPIIPLITARGGMDRYQEEDTDLSIPGYKDRPGRTGDEYGAEARITEAE